MKKAMLKNALIEHPAFREVTHMEQMSIAQGNGAIDYSNFVDFMQKIATEQDRPLMASTDRRTPRRQVNVHGFSQPSCVRYNDEDDADYADSGPEEQFGSVSVNATASTRRRYPSRRPALPKAVWNTLTQEDQVVWDQMSDAEKKAIMFAYKDPKTDAPPQDDQPPHPTESSCCRVYPPPDIRMMIAPMRRR